MSTPTRVIRNVAQLLDVLIASPADKDVLAYDSATSKWKNRAAASANTANALVLRDGNGDFAGRTITASGTVSASLFSGGTVVAGSGSSIGWSGRSQLQSTADGNILLQNNAGTDFGLLRLGGTSASFPAIKRSGTTLQVRLADDSALAPLSASVLEAGTSTDDGSGAKVQSAGDVSLLASTATTVGSGRQIKFYRSDGFAPARIEQIHNGGSSGSLVFSVADLAGTMTERMRVSYTGFVSFGSISDDGASKFAVGGDGKISGKLLIGTSSTTNFPDTTLDVFGGPLTLSAASTTTKRPQYNATPSWITSTDASRKARVAFNVYDTAAREYMRADSTGSVANVFMNGGGVVGIGATADDGSGAKLQVTGSLHTSGSVSASAVGTVGDVNAGGRVYAATGIGVGNFESLSGTPGTIVGRLQLFNTSAVPLGYIPVYDSI